MIGASETLDDEIEKLQYIPLIPNEKAYLSAVRKLVYHSKYFILLCYQRGAVYFFNHKGVFQFILSPKGTGPLEFSSAQDIALYDENTLLICDNTLSKVVLFVINNQQITNDWRLKSPPFSIACHKNYTYLITNDPVEGSIKSIKNLDFDHLQSFIKPNEIFNLIVSPKPFLTYHDTLFINEGFTDTIYYATEDGKIKPYAAIGRGASALSGANKEEIQNVVFAVDTKAASRVASTLIPSGFF